MKYFKIIISVILSVLLLYIARLNSKGQPENFTHTDNGYTFEMVSVPKGVELSKVELTLKVKPPEGNSLDSNLKVVLRKTKFGQGTKTKLYQYETIPMQLMDTTSNLYSIEQSTGNRGDRFYYYFEVRDSIGGRRALFTMPEEKPFVLKYIGHVPILILAGHLFFIFATALCISMGSVNSLEVIRNGSSMAGMAKWLWYATIMLFIGGYPVGFAMNYYAFNGLWEGVPFGTDATDNKTQIIFVYLIMVNLMTLATLTKGKFGKDVYSPKIRGWFGLGSFFVMLAMYLIPHSIQFAPSDTYTFCCSFTALVAVIYLIGLMSKKYPYKPV